MPKPRYKPLNPLRSERQVLRECLGVLQILGVDAGRQNTGGMINERGRYVSFGEPGNSDITGMIPRGWGWASGVKFDLEVKRQGFTPERCYGKARERWETQVERLRKTNDNGGVGLWTDDAMWLKDVLFLIRDRGVRVRIGPDEWPVLYEESDQ